MVRKIEELSVRCEVVRGGMNLVFCVCSDVRVTKLCVSAVRICLGLFFG